MSLIPIEGLGVPSQKTSLLGGVAQILINSRPSPRLADVDYLFDPNPNNFVANPAHDGQFEPKTFSLHRSSISTPVYLYGDILHAVLWYI